MLRPRVSCANPHPLLSVADGEQTVVPIREDYRLALLHWKSISGSQDDVGLWQGKLGACFLLLLELLQEGKGSS